MKNTKKRVKPAVLFLAGVLTMGMMQINSSFYMTGYFIISCIVLRELMKMSRQIMKRAATNQ